MVPRARVWLPVIATAWFCGCGTTEPSAQDTPDDGATLEEVVDGSAPGDGSTPGEPETTGPGDAVDVGPGGDAQEPVETTEEIEPDDTADGEDGLDAVEPGDTADVGDTGDVPDADDAEDAPEPDALPDAETTADTEDAEDLPDAEGPEDVTPDFMTCLETLCGPVWSACGDDPGCAGLHPCLDTCAEDADCETACLEAAGPEGQQKWWSAVQCGVDNGCFDAPGAGTDVVEDAPDVEEGPDVDEALTMPDPVEPCLEEQCPEELATCEEVDDCAARISCLGDCEEDAVPSCGDEICSLEEDPETCSVDCTGDPEEVQTLEEAIKALNQCYEDCMMANAGQPPTGWSALQECADVNGCLDMEAITYILPPDEDGEGGGTPTCGNDVCQWEAGEDAEMCPEDCEGKDPPECSNTLPCPAPSWCESGYCVCADGYECDGVCLDIQTSLEHCGECGNPCPENSVCNQGQCECAGDTLPCGDTCANIDWDAAHCGACFDACAPWMSCLAGLCSDTPPRPMAPLSGGTVSSRRPTFEVELPAGGEEAHVSVCADRYCQEVIASFSLPGGVGAPPDDLPTGALFWRAQTAGAGVTGYESSPSWIVRIRAWSTPVDTAWPAGTDLNMDGLADVVVGACGAEACTSSIFIHYASTEGLSSLPDSEIAEPAGSGVGFGFAVANGGDTAGDGYVELLVGSHGDDDVFLYNNTGTGLSPGPSWTWTVAPGEHSLASAGDVNRDGYGDVVAVADAGLALYLGLGSTWGVTELTSIALPFDDTGAMGWTSAVDSAGDVNGDGYSDVVVGAAGADSVVLYPGGADGLDPTAASVLSGTGQFGGSVAGVGDVNGDGYTDVMVGAPGAGEAHLFLGGPEGLSQAPELTLTDPDISDLGRRISGAGDVNGDGLSDVIIGGAGGALVLMGSTGLPQAEVVFVPAPLGKSSQDFGWDVGSPGDVDGDGYDEILVGDPGVGKVFLYKGTPDGPDTSSNPQGLGGLEKIQGFGSSLAGARTAR